jgi:hypothetical protein
LQATIGAAESGAITSGYARSITSRYPMPGRYSPNIFASEKSPSAALDNTGGSKERH